MSHIHPLAKLHRGYTALALACQAIPRIAAGIFFWLAALALGARYAWTHEKGGTVGLLLAVLLAALIAIRGARLFFVWLPAITPRASTPRPAARGLPTATSCAARASSGNNQP
jgi:hypothetical protein